MKPLGKFLVALLACVCPHYVIAQKEQKSADLNLAVEINSNKGSELFLYVLTPDADLKNQPAILQTPAGQVARTASGDAISGFKFTPLMEGDSVRVQVSAVTSKGEQAIASYLLGRGETARVSEMARFGVKPFDIKIVIVRTASTQPSSAAGYPHTRPVLARPQSLPQHIPAVSSRTVPAALPLKLKPITKSALVPVESNKPVAPPFNFTSLTGEQFDLASLRGKVVVLNFWFVGCPPCREEIPVLNGLAKDFENQDVVFLALAIDDAPELQAFLKEVPFSYRIIPNAGSVIIRTFKSTVFPTHVLIDKEGRVQLKLEGSKQINLLREGITHLVGS